MAYNNNKQTQLKSTDVNFKTRTSFSWDRAFFTSDGFLAAEELSSMIEGGRDDIVKYQLQRTNDLEAKLFQDIEASIQNATKTSKSTNSSTSLSSIKNKVSRISRTGKDNAYYPLRTPLVVTTKKKVSRISRTSPASPVSQRSPCSSPSLFAVNLQSKRRGSDPCKLSVNNEKPSSMNERRNNDQKASKTAVRLMHKTQSSISLKIKPSPVTSYPSTPSGPLNSSSRSKSRGIKGSPVYSTSKPALKNHPIGQTSDPNQKQPAKAKTAATANTGLKPNSPKTKKQSSPKVKALSENVFIISPEILDLKGKINALKMEIDMHKDRCNKMARAEGNGNNLKTTITCK